jgi:hypothetical protein
MAEKELRWTIIRERFIRSADASNCPNQPEEPAPGENTI